MSRRALVLGAVGLLLGSALAVRILSEADWNPTVMVRFGEDWTEQNEYARSMLGDDIVIAPQGGHDGRFFFIQGMDPFYVEPEVHAVQLDRPTYRAQRMAYPTLASLGGLLGPWETTWGLIVVNILALGVGTYFTAMVAMKFGLSHWFGLAFLVNPGILVEQNINGGGIIAVAALMAGVYYAMSDRFGVAAVALTVAVLARETMLIAVVGIVLYQLLIAKRKEWVLVWPVVGAVAWWGFLRMRIEDGVVQDTEALGLPFVGLFQAAQRWFQSSGHELDILGAIILIFISLSLLWKSWKRPTILGWSVAGFAILGFCLSAPVWYRYFDSSRAMAPVLTAYLILLPALSRADGAQPTVPAQEAERMP